MLVLFLPILDMCLAIVRRLSKGQSPMHPDRMHLHHRMLRIGHTVQGAVLILWGWASLIAFGSIMILFFKAQYVLIGFLIAAALLTVATMYPYLKHRIPEIREENAISGCATRVGRTRARRQNARWTLIVRPAQSQEKLMKRFAKRYKQLLLRLIISAFRAVSQ